MRWFTMPTLDIQDEEDENGNSNKKSTKNMREVDLSKLGAEPQEGFAYIQMKMDAKMINADYEKLIQKRIAKQVKIRRATKEDIPKLVDMYNRSFLSASDPYSPMNEENMKAVFEHNLTIILIGSIWGVDAGFVIIDFEGENNEIGVIAGLGTLPEWQKRGLGTTLGIASWEYFKKAGVKELKCEVFNKNMASYNLIKGMGFTPSGVKFYSF